MRRLTHEDYQRIRAACDAADQRTHAHFAAVVTPASDRYELFPLAWSAIVALVVGGVMAVGWSHLPLRVAFGIEAAAFVILSLVLEWQPLRLLLVPRHIKDMRARRMARREFSSRVLAHREHRNGVLLFVSLGERYVEIITSPDLHAVVASDVWQPIIADFVAAVRSGRTVDGIVTSIAACGDLLAVHCPPAAPKS